MFIQDADKMIARLDPREPDAYLYTIRQGSVWSVQNLGYQPSEKEQKEVAEYLSQAVGLAIPLTVSNAILDLYPDAKIGLSIEGLETSCRDMLSFAIAHFLTGCDWPRQKENQQQFYAVLKQQMAQVLEELGEPVVEVAEPFFKVETSEIEQPSLSDNMGIHITSSTQRGKCFDLREALKSQEANPKRWLIFRDPDGVSAPKDDKSE